MSSIGWVDFSSTDRDKVAAVLAMLQEPGTLDELGIGQIRDAFADMLFPGFSTIQTRAKYFITIPRLIRDYQALPHRQQRKQSLVHYLEEQEHLVAQKLVKHHGENETGIIGASRVNGAQGVARRPSSIYWNGLRLFRLVNTRFSLSEFSRSLSSQEHTEGTRFSEDDDQDVHSTQHLVHLDRHDPDWMTKLSLKLTQSEARFLAEKLTHNQTLKDAVVSQVLLHDIGTELLDDDHTMHASPYRSFPALCRKLIGNKAVSETCRMRLQCADEFSEAIAGAHYRYNILIASKARNQALVDSLEEQYQEEWVKPVTERKVFYPGCADSWIQCASEQNARINPTAQTFVRSWADAILNNKSTQELDALVQERALHNKGKRSLLQRSLGETPGWQGMERLSYRWGTAQIILADIQEGL